MPKLSASEFAKAEAEVPILRDFINFVNRQSGVYMDCLAGFEGNTVRTERQVARISRAHPEVKNGKPVMVWVSTEDPSEPDIVHFSLVKHQDYLANNAPQGPNEQQVCWSIIVFIFAYWDEDIRPALAEIRGCDPNDIKLDALGDLRLIRNAIVHSNGVLPAPTHAKLKIMGGIVKPDEMVAPSHEGMHQLFVSLKRAVGELISHYVGPMPDGGDWSTIKDIAFENAGPRVPRKE
jgi:hypothetical protein